MTAPKIDYIGPESLPAPSASAKKLLWKRIPYGFLIVVCIPTLISIAYFSLVASSRYVSEARFVVRSANANQPSAVGLALQGVGFSTGINDAFAIHEYIMSRDALENLKNKHDVAGIFGRRDADLLSRYPRPGEKPSDEALYKAFQRFTTVGYDAATGISTLRVEAFSPQDAQALNRSLLDSGEALVNRLNDRASQNAVQDAKDALLRAQEEVRASQSALTALRNSAQFIDPRAAAAESSQLIGGLLVTVAQLRAERAQLQAQAPSSPELPLLNQRITAYENQIAAARAAVAGSATSLAPKVGKYEEMTVRREMADKQLAQATSALLTAEQEARRQKLYLERIVEPSLPDAALLPKRWLAILTVFASSLLAYGVGWLVWAGVREHRQD